MNHPKTPTLAPNADPSEVQWEVLLPHAERDGLILVKPGSGLALQEAALTIAQDQSQRVSAWIEQGLLFKPTREQIAQWSETPQKLFFCFVLQPYVIAQEYLPN